MELFRLRTGRTELHKLFVLVWADDLDHASEIGRKLGYLVPAENWERGDVFQFKTINTKS